MMVAFWMAVLIKSQSLKRFPFSSRSPSLVSRMLSFFFATSRELIENKKLMATKTFSYSQREREKARQGMARIAVKILWKFFLFIYSACSSGNRFTSFKTISRMCVYAIFFITALSSSIVRVKKKMYKIAQSLWLLQRLSAFSLQNLKCRCKRLYCHVYNHKYIQIFMPERSFWTSSSSARRLPNCQFQLSNKFFYSFLFLVLTKAKF